MSEININNSLISFEIEHYEYIPEDSIKHYNTVLSQFSVSDFYSSKWKIEIASSNRIGILVFPEKMDFEESKLLKCFVINQLTTYASINICRRCIYDAYAFLNFLSKKNLLLENTRSLTICAFKKYLNDDTALSNAQKNSIFRVTSQFIYFASAIGVITERRVIDCSYRWPEEVEQKRAPDMCVVNALDMIFFNECNIPNTYRCLYYLLRMISNRISEVLAMQTDCITYIGVNVFAVSIPTSKETPYHVPVYHKYNRLLYGKYEGILLNSLLLQKHYVLEKDLTISIPNKGYLFVSPNASDALVTTADFNLLLARVCDEYNVLNADGSRAHITSHDFRHIAISERLQGDIISPYMTMVESNHSRVEQTLAYGHPSLNDEANHYGKIAESVFSEEYLEIKYDGKAVVIPKRKYERLQDQPFTRIIPGYGLCCEKACVPRFQICFSCEYFYPSKIYKDYVETTIKILQDKLTKLTLKGSNSEAINYNERQLKLYRIFIERVNNNSMEECYDK